MRTTYIYTHIYACVRIEKYNPRKKNYNSKLSLITILHIQCLS